MNKNKKAFHIEIAVKPLSPERGRGSKNLGLQRKPLVFAGEGEP
jgi:hypothetical protein